MDFFEETEDAGWLEKALKMIREQLQDMPLLFTFRTKEEGGEKSISLEDYQKLCLDAADTGMADLVDVELNRGEELLRTIAEKLQEKGVKVVGSFHDFKKTPEKEEIIRILTVMQELGVDITKAAVMPQRERDVLTLLEASLSMKEQWADRPFITMSMSRMGSISRLAGSLTGSSLTFATAGRASAPGQMDAEALERVLNLL